MRGDFLDGLTVTIRVDGQDLREYDLGSEAESAYIEVASGQQFTVEVRYTMVYRYPRDDISCAVYLHGKYIDAVVSRAHDVMVCRPLTCRDARGYVNGVHQLRPLHFGALATIEGSS